MYESIEVTYNYVYTHRMYSNGWCKRTLTQTSYRAIVNNIMRRGYVLQRQLYIRV